jgi:DNA-directed RNA polymerase subunit RPC12/RpoP
MSLHVCWNRGMAQGFRFVCSDCKRAITAWDEGNPYYFDEHGKKRYAYHPDEERDQCTGNDTDYLCLACGRQFRREQLSPKKGCTKCRSPSIIDTWLLDGKPCPYCRKGRFGIDPTTELIS